MARAFLVSEAGVKFGRVFLAVLSAALAGTVVVSITRAVEARGRDASLMAAVESRQPPQTIRALMRQGADPNATDDGACLTALVAAANLGPPETVQALLDAGAPISARGVGGTSPMHAVAESADLTGPQVRAIMYSLRGRGEGLEERDALGYTPLLRALWNGNPAATRILLGMGADTRTVNDYGQDVWYWAKWSQNPPETAELLRILNAYVAAHPAKSTSPHQSGRRKGDPGAERPKAAGP